VRSVEGEDLWTAAGLATLTAARPLLDRADRAG
jgi:hypothetical protein